MNKKQATVALGILAVWHMASIVKDAERYQANWKRWQAVPTAANLIKLVAAEGMLIGDLGWLF
jgi:hypothetical protein